MARQCVACMAFVLAYMYHLCVSLVKECDCKNMFTCSAKFPEVN